MDPKFLLAVMVLVHAPIVFGCVDFHAQFHPGANLGDPWPLQISLVDNGNEVCSLDSTPNNGAQYDLGCSSGYSATFDPNANDSNGSVNYNPPWGNFTFATIYTYSEAGNNPGSYDASPYC